MYGTVYVTSRVVKQPSAHFLTATQEVAPLPVYTCMPYGVAPPTSFNEKFSFHSEESQPMLF